MHQLTRRPPRLAAAVAVLARTGWHVNPGPALVTVKTGQLTLHRA